MKVLVNGSWNEKKSRKYESQAEELGYLLAERGHILVASPSSGIQGLVAQAYKSSGGQHFIGFYPDLNIMNQMKEKVLVEPDEKIMTGQCYPIRNIMQIKDSDAVITITGGAGTLTEVIAAVKDYNLPVSYFSGSSSIMDGYLKLDSFFEKKIHISQNIPNLVDYLESSLSGMK